MKRFIKCSIMVLTVIGLFVGCAAPEPSPAPTPAPEAGSKPTLAPVATSEPTPTPRPADMSYTTGLHYAGEYKPVMVVIENSPAARPQLGLQAADVVYEVPVESSITRFVCVFSDTMPEKVMPVRSGRITFLEIQQEWDAMFLHWGGSGSGMSTPPPYTFFGSALHGKIKIDMDGNSGSKYKKILYHKDGKQSTHNVIAEVQAAQALYDYSPAPLNWQFDSNAVYTGKDGTEVKLALCSSDGDYVSYTYDAQKDAYLRFMSGKVFKSAETGEQVSVKNVIVQYANYEVITESKDKYKVWEMVGSGAADYYIGGKRITGTWKKESSQSQTMFYDDKGGPVVLRSGNTWIHLSPKTK